MASSLGPTGRWRFGPAAARRLGADTGMPCQFTVSEACPAIKAERMLARAVSPIKAATSAMVFPDTMFDMRPKIDCLVSFVGLSSFGAGRSIARQIQDRGREIL